MKRILIADASKASLVMTSEVFKDHFPGVQVVVARSSADAIELAKTAGELDAFIIDYDLPDRDGAYTAARLKKMFRQPILITAFDRPDVHEAIDRDLSAFDDCLSWLKKPVKTELVVSLAQRFIEGKHRCQRRLSCSIPGFLEVEFTPAAAVVAQSNVVKTMQVARVKAKPTTTKVAQKAAAANKKTVTKAPSKGNQKQVVSATKAGKATAKTKLSNKVEPQKEVATKREAATKKEVAKTLVTRAEVTKKQAVAPAQPVRKIIPVLIDDVSLGGVKIRIQNQELMMGQAGKGKKAPAMFDLREGQILEVHVPPSHIVESGPEALEKWQKAQAKELNSALAVKTEKTSKKSSKSITISPLGQRTREALTKADEHAGEENQSKSNSGLLKGEIRWVASSEMFTFCGLRSETVNVSKKLFEAMIEIEARLKNHLSPIVSPNTPRGAKLNA